MPESSIKNFSREKMTALRKHRGLSQMELSIMVGMHYLTVTNWERGYSTPTAPSLRKLARALRCREDALLTRRDAAA